MPLVKVWNDNVHDFKQEVKGTMIQIPARGFVDMEYEEAIDFKGMFSPMPPPDFAGDHSLFFKMIRVEAPPPESVFRDDGLVNHLTGKRAGSPEELALALAQVRDLLIRDPEAERAAKPAQDSEVSDLKKQVAELTALVSGLVGEKRGPGRPRKEA